MYFQVDHPEKYGFNPKQLLNHLTDIYLHLRGDVLARAIATDERSYRRELFETCTELLRNKNIKSEVHAQGLKLSEYIGKKSCLFYQTSELKIDFLGPVVGHIILYESYTHLEFVSPFNLHLMLYAQHTAINCLPLSLLPIIGEHSSVCGVRSSGPEPGSGIHEGRHHIRRHPRRV